MSTLKVDTIQGKTTSGTVAMPADMVVQTKFHSFSTQTTTTSTSDVDITDSSFSFTPKFASSLLIIRCDVAAKVSRNSSAGNGWSLHIAVDGTKIMPANNRYENYYEVSVSNNHTFYVRNSKEVSLNASNTSAKTIKLIGNLYTDSNSGTFFINDSGDYTSSIRVMEIAQ